MICTLPLGTVHLDQLDAAVDAVQDRPKRGDGQEEGASAGAALAGALFAIGAAAGPFGEVAVPAGEALGATGCGRCPRRNAPRLARRRHRAAQDGFGVNVTRE